MNKQHSLILSTAYKLSVFCISILFAVSPVSSGIQLSSGSSHYLSRSGAPVTSTPLTIDFFIYPTAWNGVVVWLGEDNAGVWRAHYLGLGGTGEMNACTVQNNAFECTNTPAGVAPLNQWVHVTAVFASSTSREVFINGVSKGTNTNSMTPTGINVLYVGADKSQASPGNFTSAIIDDLKIYNRALTAAEISQTGGVMTRMTITNGLVAHYKMMNIGDGVTATGATVTDSSGNGYTLTATNNPTWRGSSIAYP